MSETINETINLEKNIRSELESIRKDVRARELDLEYEIEIGKDEIEITVDLYTTFMEISESCSISDLKSFLEHLDLLGVETPNIPDNVEYVEDIEDPDLRKKVEDLIDEYVDECINSTIEEINGEYCLYGNIIIKTPLYEVYTKPIECEGDYCKVGGSLTFKIKSRDFSDVMYGLRILRDVIDLYLELR